MKMNTVDDLHSHSVYKDGKKHTWYVKRLWNLATHLPEFDFEISSFVGFDEDFWFGDRFKPTIGKVLEHCRKINDADNSHPIIISADGLIMDGVHRICRAYLEGKKTIRAVKFDKTPEPDLIT